MIPDETAIRDMTAVSVEMPYSSKYWPEDCGSSSLFKCLLLFWGLDEACLLKLLEAGRTTTEYQNDKLRSHEQ